jgi:hypothetical protein
MQAKKTCAQKPLMRDSTSVHERRCHKTTLNRAVEVQTTRTNRVPSLCVSPGLDLGIMARKPEQLPDPWLFDSEALLRELERCRETVLQIPITNPNATHFGIQLAVNAIYNLTESLRYLLHLHREQQRSIRRQHEETLAHALAAGPQQKSKIVHLHKPTPSNGKKPNNTHATRERLAKRRRASSVTSSQVA